MLSDATTIEVLALLGSLDPADLTGLTDVRVLVEELPGRTAAAAARVGRVLLLVLDPGTADGAVHALAAVRDLARGTIAARHIA